MTDPFCLMILYLLVPYVGNTFFSMTTLENTLDFKGKLIHNNVNAKKKTVSVKQNLYAGFQV
jgi:hypothetical protein